MMEPLRLEPLFPERGTGEPLAAQLARRLRDAVENGTLAPGTKMLGSRQLALRLGIARNTVTLAFEQLVAEGYLTSRSGSGTFVTPSRFQRARRPTVTRSSQAERARFAALRGRFDAATGRGPLRPGMPSLASFPRAAWNRCARRALSAYAGDIGYGHASGLDSLRREIATHVRQFRGVSALPEQVIVVEGAQSAFHLASVVLARSGDSIAIEDPCYALARAAFELYGLQLQAVRVDRDGILPGELPAKARFAFVTPTHQFPLGGTLPLSRRLKLLAWAKRHEAYVIEDDYDSEFTSRVRPLPALQSLDRDERVIYVGSFSKTLAPGLRVGYLISPPHLASAFRVARASTSLGVSLHLQATLAQFIGGGHFARHIRRANAAYETRRTILARALDPLADSFETGPMQVGLHVALIARRRFKDRAASEISEGERLVPLSELSVARSDCRGFVLGFTNGSDDEIASAADRVCRRLRNLG